MRSEAREIRLPKRRGHGRPVGAVDALDQAFAETDDTVWRRHAQPPQQAEDLSAAIRSQLASLDEQNRELTRLLERLEASRSPQASRPVS